MGTMRVLEASCTLRASLLPWHQSQADGLGAEGHGRLLLAE